MTIVTNLKRAAAGRVTPGMKAALKQIQFELKAKRIAARATTSFKALRGRRNLKVHLGAGDDLRAGWVNIDLALRFTPQVDLAHMPNTVFINHDLRRGLFLDDDSCERIYSSHFFEHLNFSDGLNLMRECHRTLEQGGVFRFSLPDIPAFFDAYRRKDRDFFELIKLEALYSDLPQDTLAWVDYLNYAVYQFGEHVALYDPEKAILLLQKAGFSYAKQVEFDDKIDPDLELRRRYSFYVEAKK